MPPQTASESSYQHLATKADIQAVKTDIQVVKTDIANLRAELKDDIASLKAELKDDNANLRTDFVSFQSKIEGSVRTMLRLIVIGVSIFGVAASALIYYLSQGGI